MLSSVIVYIFLLYFYIVVGFVFVDLLFFFFKQKTAYERRISDWSSAVCSSDLRPRARRGRGADRDAAAVGRSGDAGLDQRESRLCRTGAAGRRDARRRHRPGARVALARGGGGRSGPGAAGMADPHDAAGWRAAEAGPGPGLAARLARTARRHGADGGRESTRLTSSHSYAARMPSSA